MEFVHEMVEVPEGVKLTHQINIRGALAFLWARIIGEKTLSGLPIAMGNLVQLAKGMEAHV